MTAAIQCCTQKNLESPTSFQENEDTAKGSFGSFLTVMPTDFETLKIIY
jgi:hypothetical protein